VKQAETLFGEKVDRDLRKMGGVWFNINQVSIRGTPDRIGCLAGRFVALELKTNEGKATPLQIHELQSIVIYGGIAAIVTPDNWEYVKSILSIEPLPSPRGIIGLDAPANRNLR